MQVSQKHTASHSPSRSVHSPIKVGWFFIQLGKEEGKQEVNNETWWKTCVWVCVCSFSWKVSTNRNEFLSTFIYKDRISSRLWVYSLSLSSNYMCMWYLHTYSLMRILWEAKRGRPSRDSLQLSWTWQHFTVRAWWWKRLLQISNRIYFILSRGPP